MKLSKNQLGRLITTVSPELTAPYLAACKKWSVKHAVELAIARENFMEFCARSGLKKTVEPVIFFAWMFNRTAAGRRAAEKYLAPRLN